VTVVILNHSMIKHKITNIRKKETKTKDFYQNVNEIASLMAFEISKDFPLKDVEIETPICKTIQKELNCEVVIVPILRAGLGMVDGIRNIIPTASVGFIGLARDEETLKPKGYYTKLPDTVKEDNTIVLVVDPMLATGGSAVAAVDIIKKSGAKKICFASLVAAPIGIETLKNAHPDIDIYVAALDEKLNEKGYIVPGLGDCGDRLFGTK
jgi:uracil phosphoribosyltransferase